jgi:hypothetical protein
MSKTIRIVTGDLTFHVDRSATTAPNVLTIHKLDRIEGIGGQFAFVVDYTRKWDDETQMSPHRARDTFVGSIYGGPVALVFPSGFQTRIDRSVERFGETLSRRWLERWFELPEGTLTGEGLHEVAPGDIRSGKD